MSRPPAQLAARLRALALPGVYVEVAEPARRGEVLKLIEAATARDSRGRCTAAGCRDLHILLYGGNAGAAAAVKLARELRKLNLSVVLTVQVDNASASDAAIPPNVA
ncbi:MAG TPA: hypothetical protein VKG84_05770, partial [Candidatus Acidoferrales bacterium]|nr:hypothetical protein [Candidatus Acidoferrales bacterium]